MQLFKEAQMWRTYHVSWETRSNINAKGKYTCPNSPAIPPPLPLTSPKSKKKKKENEEKVKKKIDKYSETMSSCSSESLNIGQRQPSVLSKLAFLNKNFSVGLQNTAHLFFRWMPSRTQLSLTSTIASILHNRKLAC